MSENGEAPKQIPRRIVKLLIEYDLNTGNVGLSGPSDPRLLFNMLTSALGALFSHATEEASEQAPARKVMTLDDMGVNRIRRIR